MISIITPIYNGLEFFPATVASVEAQTTGDWEWLLIDDGSSDGSLDFCLDAARRDSRIRVLRHPNGANLGQSASRNLAIRHSLGDFLTLLDCDDLWIPEKLELDIATFERHPRAMFLYSRLLNWYDWANPPEASVRNKAGFLGIACDEVLEPPTVLLHVLRSLYDSACQYPATCSLMMRRSVLSGGEELFEPTFRRNFEDVVMLTKVLLRHPAVVCDDIRSVYRRHPHSFTAGQSLADYDGDFRAAARWITSYVAPTSSGIQDAVASALEFTLRHGIHHRRKMRFLGAVRKLLPLRFREWLWLQYGKRGLL